VIEEVAYTWFNRFLALRFMEVNGYLPDRVKIFTDSDNRFQPQILNEAIDLEIDGLDMEKVYAYKDANQTEELYKYLLVVQCNALNAVLPGMFQKIEDYTELLLPELLVSGVAYGRSDVPASVSDMAFRLSDAMESISDMTASVSLPDNDLLTDPVLAVSSEFCSPPSESDTAVWKETPNVSPAIEVTGTETIRLAVANSAITCLFFISTYPRFHVVRLKDIYSLLAE